MANDNQKRAQNRLARVRVADSKALPNIKPSAHGKFSRDERYAILGAVHDLQKKQRTDKAAKDKAAGETYNPLAPLSGPSMQREIDASANLQFGPQERKIKDALTGQGVREQQTASGYDQYRQALKDATDRINTANAGAVKDSQDRVDTSFAQDKAAVEARDKAAADKASRIGLSAAPSTAGAQAVEAARSQGNQAVSGLRARGTADTTFMENRGANSVLGKTEAMSREGDKRAQLENAMKDVAKQRGEFGVEQRGKLRASEREWAAIQKEFKLKETDQAARNKTSAADRKLEAQKQETQRIVAGIYASADKAKARAQIRVAKLQLDKGKIDQHQYRTIVNTYKGLPAKGKSPQAKNPKTPQGSGSGPNGSLAPWETDKIDRAVNSLEAAKAGPKEKQAMINKLIKANIPARLARIAWRRYEKSLLLTYPH